MEFSEKNLLLDPIEMFAQWFEEAKRHPDIQLPEAFCLSTVDPHGLPEGRMMLLKGFDTNGFVFYTNLQSPKARSLSSSPNATLTFYWERLRHQVRIQGRVEPVSVAESDDYFRTRPRLSQIGAWSSRQSESLDSREALTQKFEGLQKQFNGKEIPRPPFWGGFRLIPSHIEFWQEQTNRLHDRFLYARQKNGWEIKRLFP